MILLLDTHLLLWAAYEPGQLGGALRTELEEPTNTLAFSAVSIWEVSVKAGLGRPDFTADPRVLRRGLLGSNYLEIAVTASHAAAVVDLPRIHRDPFDRMLITQARVEGVTLLTRDAAVVGYGPPVREV